MKFLATVLLTATVLSAKCSKDSGSVCGKDNVTYDNVCDLDDAKVKLASCLDCKSAKKESLAIAPKKLLLSVVKMVLLMAMNVS